MTQDQPPGPSGRRSLARKGGQERTLLDALFNDVPNAIAVVDHAGRFLTVNPGFRALFGFAPEEVLGRALVDMIVGPSDRAAALRLQERARANETIVTECNRRCKDGRMVTVRVSVTAASVAEEPAVLFLYMDITEIRRTEESLRAAQARVEQVMASSTAVIYATKVDGEKFTPTWVSENLTRITGHEVAEALDPEWWAEQLHPDDRDGVFACLPVLLRDGHLITEYRFRVKNGSYRWIHDESRLIRDASGQPLEIFGAWLDVTDRKLAEETMREGRDLAERSVRARAAFLANMSHEIRTPMNAVLGLTELVLDTELSAYQRSSLGMVRSAAETLLTLLNDVLDSAVEGFGEATTQAPSSDAAPAHLSARTADQRLPPSHTPPYHS